MAGNTPIKTLADLKTWLQEIGPGNPVPLTAARFASPSALTGFLITPIPRTPVTVNDVPLIQLLFAQEFATGFSYQQAVVDPDYTVTASIDSAQDLIVGISGKHTATLTNKDYILSALVDPWITSPRYVHSRRLGCK
ncbi:MAG TPA: hypothetical protein VMS31_22800 [Pyrinomonadaceae bacterium]|nr:hypothetical protein [Pyrinomonadaceae bacterium]